MSNERYPLRQIILDDLTSNNKIALLLLIGVIISGIATIWITHQTRQLIAENGKLIQENELLDHRYDHLILEENASSHKTRVEAVANKLGLQPVKKEQEIILVK